MSGGYSQRLLIVIRKMIDDTLARWNPFTNDTTLSVPRSALPAPEDSPYAAAESAYDAHFFWGLPLAQTVPVEGDAYLWNAMSGTFQLGAAAGGGDEGGTAAGFRASLPAQQVIGAAFSKIELTNEIQDLGDFYTAASAVWTPPAGPVAFVYRVVTTDNRYEPQIQIRRNGVAIYERYGGRYSLNGQGWSESAFIDIASAGDSYELHVALADATLTTDTFWAGMVAGSSGGGGGGGGLVPAPYAYLVDTDGAYLLDADGAYLYERLL